MKLLSQFHGVNNYQTAPFNVFDRDNFQRVAQMIKPNEQALWGRIIQRRITPEIE
jgi:hypothetical protein